MHGQLKCTGISAFGFGVVCSLKAAEGWTDVCRELALSVLIRLICFELRLWVLQRKQRMSEAGET